jgi:hypothetical protein
MNKRELVEIESAFLEFCLIAEKLGYKFNWGSNLSLHHTSHTEHDVRGDITLNPLEFLKED